MPFEHQWYVEGRVTVARDWGQLTLAQMRERNRLLLADVRSGTPPVHVLIDARSVTRFPGSFIPMLRELDGFRHEPNMGWTILLTSSALLYYFGVLSSNLSKMPFRAVSSYQEANDLLRRVDPTLDPLLPDDWGIELS